MQDYGWLCFIFITFLRQVVVFELGWREEKMVAAISLNGITKV